MYLRRVAISLFRNINDVQLYPSSGVTAIIGDNGQGKTSLLEAIYLAGNLKCVRSSRVTECVQWEREKSSVEVESERFTFFVEIGSSGEKVKKINGKSVSTQEYLRKITIIGFFPGEETKIFSSPRFMRNLIDRGIFYLDRSYLAEFSRFRKLLSDRNSLLQSDKFDLKLFEVVNEEFKKMSERIESWREDFIQNLNEEIARVSGSLSGGEWMVRVDYRRAGQVALEREKRYGYSLYGPHRSMVEFLINGKPARRYASRGQIKIILLSYKLSVAGMLERKREKTVFLIDDIGGELDSARRSYLLNFIKQNQLQAFVTSTSPVEETDDMYVVERGRIWKQS